MRNSKTPHKRYAACDTGVSGLRIIGVFLLACGVNLLAQVADAARSHAPAGDQLIQIGVEVVEVDEQKMESLGIAWVGMIHLEEAPMPPLFKLGEVTRGQLMADLHALVNDGAADILANPKLITRDGTTATFHAGGELPYATQSGNTGSVSVEFKPYGVNLEIHPRALADDRIALAVSAEVSGPDVQNSVTLSGNVVPGIRSRHVSSELTMEPGSTLTMAGLLQNQKQWVRSGIPGLMYIPFLGRLFSHKVEKIQKTSVVVFITPSFLDTTTGASGLPAGNPPANRPAIEFPAESDELFDALRNNSKPPAPKPAPPLPHG